MVPHLQPIDGHLFMNKRSLKRIQKRLDEQGTPSELALTLVKDLNAKRLSRLFGKAVSSYNRKHDRKIFL